MCLLVLQVSALKEQKLEDDVSLDEEIDRNWIEVVQGTYRFDHLVQEVWTIRTLVAVTGCFSVVSSTLHNSYSIRTEMIIVTVFS